MPACSTAHPQLRKKKKKKAHQRRRRHFPVQHRGRTASLRKGSPWMHLTNPMGHGTNARMDFCLIPKLSTSSAALARAARASLGTVLLLQPAHLSSTPVIPATSHRNGPGYQIQPVGFSFLKDLIAGLCSFSQLFVFLFLSHAIGKRLSFIHTQCALCTSVSRNLCTTTFDPGRQL